MKLDMEGKYMGEVQLNCEFCGWFLKEDDGMNVCGCDESEYWGEWVDIDDSCEEWKTKVNKD